MCEAFGASPDDSVGEVCEEVKKSKPKIRSLTSGKLKIEGPKYVGYLGPERYLANRVYRFYLIALPLFEGKSPAPACCTFFLDIFFRFEE